MIHAKNYETVFKFVKVMPRKLVASFFWTRCKLNEEQTVTSEEL